MISFFGHLLRARASAYAVLFVTILSGTPGFAEPRELPSQAQELFKSEPRQNPVELALLRSIFADSLLPSQMHFFARYFAPVGQGLGFQSLIEHIILDILNTPTGSELCRVVQDDFDIEEYFGFDSRGTRAFREVCGEKFGSLNYNPAAHELAIMGRAIRSKRNWVVMVYRTENLPATENVMIDSWTSANNVSALVLERGEISYEALALRIAHELAIFFDRRFRTDIVWANRQKLSFAKEEDGQQVDACNALPSMNRQNIAAAAQTARALNFERAVFGEMVGAGLLTAVPTELARFGELAAKEQIEFLLPYADTIARQFQPLDLLAHGMQGFSLCLNETMPILDVVIRAGLRPGSILVLDAPHIEHLDSLTVASGAGGSRQPLLDYMTTPEFGRDNMRLNSGPRPNLGRGIRGSRGGD